ncbi:MAG: hypothetical protein AAFQ98_20965 [Bacteroidota bacterium]
MNNNSEMKDNSSLEKAIGDLAEYYQHGDFQRIANLVKKKGGEETYTADYVRKVLFGTRDNNQIVKKAKQYFKKKRRMTEELAS